MALNTENNVVRYVIATGLSNYTIPFIYWEKEDLKVDVTDADDNITRLVLDVDYSLTEPNASGGTLTKVSDWSSYVTLIIARELSYTQEVDYTNGQTIDADIIETSFDQVTAKTGQLDEKISRSIVSPISEEGSDLELPLIDARKDKLLGFDSDGTAIIAIDGADIPVLAEEVSDNLDLTIIAKDEAIAASLSAKRAFNILVGDGLNLVFTINHALDTYDYLVSVWQNGGDRESVTFTASKPDVNNLVLTFDVAPSVNEYSVVITCVEESMYGVVAWADITGKPDLYTQTEIDASQLVQDNRLDVIEGTGTIQGVGTTNDVEFNKLKVDGQNLNNDSNVVFSSMRTKNALNNTTTLTEDDWYDIFVGMLPQSLTYLNVSGVFTRSSDSESYLVFVIERSASPLLTLHCLRLSTSVYTDITITQNILTSFSNEIHMWW